MVSELELMIIRLLVTIVCIFFMMGCCGWHILQVLSSENQLCAKTFLALSQVCTTRLPLHSFSVVEFLLIVTVIRLEQAYMHRKACFW